MNVARILFGLSFICIVHGLICKVIYSDIDINEIMFQALLTFMFGLGTWISDTAHERRTERVKLKLRKNE